MHANGEPNPSFDSQIEVGVSPESFHLLRKGQWEVSDALTSYISDARDVGDIEPRVRRRFDPDQARFRANSLFVVGRIAHIHEIVTQPPP